MKHNMRALLQSGRSIVILDVAHFEGLKTRIEELVKERDSFLSMILKNAPYNLGLEEESRAARLIPQPDGDFEREEIELIPYKPISKTSWKDRSFQRTKSLTPPSLQQMRDDTPLREEDAS